MFLEYNQLVKYNPEVNWNNRTIQFIRCLEKYKIQCQNIMFIFRTKRMKLTEGTDKEHQKIGKPDLTYLEDLPE